jgi:membrane protease YdiL (CAAX protease family)
MSDSLNDISGPAGSATKRCDYCGKESDESALYCIGCGTQFASPSDAANSQAPSPPVDEALHLGARSATIILLLYFAGQILGAIIAAALFAIVARPNVADLQNPKTAAAFRQTVMPPSIIGSMLGGGVALLLLSFRMAGPDLRDRSPLGAAWTFGTAKHIAQGCALGALTALACTTLASVPALQPKHLAPGPVTIMAMTPGPNQFLFLILALLIAPPVEELLFRGVLYGGYRRSFGPARAALLTTFLFLAMHLTEVIPFAAAAVGITGMALAALWLRLRSGAVGPAIAAHFAYNGTISLFVLAATRLRG